MLCYKILRLLGQEKMRSWICLIMRADTIITAERKKGRGYDQEHAETGIDRHC